MQKALSVGLVARFIISVTGTSVIANLVKGQNIS